MDIEQIRQLVELMVANDLSRLELREGETHVLIRRGQPTVLMSSAAGSAVPAGAVCGSPPGVAETGAQAAPPAEGANEVFIRSPMVGTFYAAADPESPPFVNVGDVIGPETVVCLIEAMKVFNEIKGEVTGRITKVLVKNAQAVEYDQPLFAVTPA
jgi:acetyl-CoA carboxylase biotin carboxyl carrier protein